MRTARVWAPGKHTVTIDLSGARIPMDPNPLGWWSADLGDAAVDYGFILDSGSPFPDPRSPFQPRGVHALSRWIDHDLFSWTDRGWSAPPLDSAVLYELHIGTFTAAGTFDAAIDRIPHLVELGVTHVEIMPVAEFDGDWGWGYDGVDLYAPHHGYGGPDGLKRLVDALHRHGLAAILDVVYNHLGPSGNYLRQFGPYFTAAVQTPWGDAVNLGGPGSDHVREYLIENALMWLRDYHFDGLRLDAVHALVDSSALHFLEELADRVRRLERELGRTLFITAESDLNDPRLIRSPECGGYGFDAIWSDDFHHALHTVLTGELTGYYSDFGSLSHLAKAVEDGFVYDGQFSAFRNRRHGRKLDSSLKKKLVVFLQNHDQIGNRAAGNRIDTMTSPGRLRIGSALVLLGPFIPLLFQGEEWGASTPFQYFTNHTDPELGHAVSEGRRREFAAFGWTSEEVPDPQDLATFQRSKLNWNEIGNPKHQQIFDWHRRLIQFRKEHPGVRSAEAHATFDATGLFVMQRPGIAVACNLSNVPIPLERNRSTELLLHSAEDSQSGGREILLAPDSVAILNCDACAAPFVSAAKAEIS